MTDDETDTTATDATDEQDAESTGEESLREKVQRLESLVEHQQRTVEHQQETIEQLQARQETDSDGESESADREQPAHEEPDTDAGLTTPATRRGVLTSAGILGLLGLGMGTASASSKTPSGQIGTSNSPLMELYTEELNGGVTGDTSLTDLAGSGLTIDDSGNLNASGGGSTSELVTSGNSLTAAQVFDGGTTVSESDDSSDAPLIINGHPSNNTGGVDPFGATIAGGGGDSANSNDNEASADFATVGGGKANSAIYTYSTVGGGRSNTTNESYATIPGGRSNTADGEYSFAAGRKANTNSNDGAFVWGDSSSTSVTAGAADEVRFQAKGGFVIENGNLDAQGGTVENTTGDLTLDTSGDVDLNGNTLKSSSLGTDFIIDIDSSGTDDEKNFKMEFPDNNGTTIKWKREASDGEAFTVQNVGNMLNWDLLKVEENGKVSITRDDLFMQQGDVDMNNNGDVINTSDGRLKTAIEPIENPVEKLTELEPRTYEWKDDEASDEREAGVIAQSVEDSLPEAVKEDEDGFLKLAYRQLTPLVICAVQEQQDEIETLEANLDAQEARIEDQQDHIERLEAKIQNKDVALDALRETLDDKDERITDLEGENEQLRERNAELEDRLAAVEAELGIDATASQQGVADD